MRTLDTLPEPPRTRSTPSTTSRTKSAVSGSPWNVTCEPVPTLVEPQLAALEESGSTVNVPPSAWRTFSCAVWAAPLIDQLVRARTATTKSSARSVRVLPLLRAR